MLYAIFTNNAKQILVSITSLFMVDS